MSLNKVRDAIQPFRHLHDLCSGCSPAASAGGRLLGFCGASLFRLQRTFVLCNTTGKLESPTTTRALRTRIGFWGILRYTYIYLRQGTPLVFAVINPKPRNSEAAVFVVLARELNWGFPKLRGYLRVPLKGYYKGTIRVPLKGSIRV